MALNCNIPASGCHLTTPTDHPCGTRVNLCVGSLLHGDIAKAIRRIREVLSIVALRGSRRRCEARGEALRSWAPTGSNGAVRAFYGGPEIAKKSERVFMYYAIEIAPGAPHFDHRPRSQPNNPLLGGGD
jgi:hypothetical protein